MTESSRPLSDADYQTLARFRHALRVFLHFSEEAARSEGLTPAQHQLLLAVRGHPGEAAPAVGDLAEVLQTRTHSVVGLVDRAEEAGLVVSDRDASDSRRRLVSLTREGEAVLERLSDLHRRELRRFRAEMAQVLDELG
ncbi:MAG TPA: MarR family transcriptional regulator [Acidimicrobiales bacterium]|nr:MarR family transcriptional regulator [Acidimicrobiales bacterium]